MAGMRLGGGLALLAWSIAVGVSCASTGTGGGDWGDGAVQDGSVPHDDGGGPSPDAIILGVDAGDEGTTASPDASLGGKSCVGLADGTPCGPAPDICHEAPVCASGACATAVAKADGVMCAAAPDVCHDAATCSGGTCSAPPAKPNGTTCSTAPDGCHTDATCSGGHCGTPPARADGYNWSAGDATAICCNGGETHANTDSNCGACGIHCNAGNGESCSALGGHYFCRGCVASAACWSHCCSESFSPYSCAASDCSGNCSSAYCPAGTHCVSGGSTSSDYCSY